MTAEQLIALLSLFPKDSKILMPIPDEGENGEITYTNVRGAVSDIEGYVVLK